MIENVYSSSRKVPASLVIFHWKLNFLDGVDKNTHMKFHENPSSGSRVVPCGLTDMKELIVAFRSFANARA